MGNPFGLENPFYEDRMGRFAIYPDDFPDEHKMLVDNNHFVSLVRGTLESVARGEQGALDYVMSQLGSVDVSREEVTQALLRGYIAELRERLNKAVQENFEMRHQKTNH